MNRSSLHIDSTTGAEPVVSSVIRAIDRDGNAGALASLLLRAQTPTEVASVLFAYEPALARSDARLLWSQNWPLDIQSEPAGAIDPQIRKRVMAIVEGGRQGVHVDPRLRVLCDDGGPTVAVLQYPQTDDAISIARGVLDAVGVRMAESLVRCMVHWSCRAMSMACASMRQTRHCWDS